MPDKKRTMNDMIVTKKPVVKKQVLKVEEYVEKPRVVAPEVVYHREVSETNRSGCLLWIVAAVCIVALVIGIGGLFTHAEIVVVPKQWQGPVDVTMNLSQSQDNGTVFFGTATKTFTSEKIVPSIGRAPSEVKATGTITFSNTNTIAKTISAKTVMVSTSDKKYVLDKTITIPPRGAKDPGRVAGTVTAVEAGAAGNSDPDDIVFAQSTKTLAGITMRAVDGITGGTNDADAVGDPTMIAAATEELKKEFFDPQILIKRLAEQVPDEFVVLPVPPPVTPVRIVADPHHEDGVHVVASQTVTILVVHRQDIARVFGERLGVSKDARATIEDFTGMTVLANGMVLGQPIPKTLQVRATGTATIFGDVYNKEIQEKVIGISRKELKDFMGTVPEVDTYKLRMRPFWRRVLPVNGDDIEVIH